MGHHINAEGQFQSDKYADLGPDKVVMSFKDPSARYALLHYCNHERMRDDMDTEFVEDLETRLSTFDPNTECECFDFSEALRRMKAGKKVARETHCQTLEGKNVHVYSMEFDEFFQTNTETGGFDVWTPEADDLMAVDWMMART